MVKASTAALSWPPLMVSATCASTNNALLVAKLWLDAAKVDDVLVVVADLSVTPEIVAGLTRLVAAAVDVEPLDACRPFQEAGEGRQGPRVVLGSAAAFNEGKLVGAVFDTPGGVRSVRARRGVLLGTSCSAGDDALAMLPMATGALTTRCVVGRTASRFARLEFLHSAEAYNEWWHRTSSPRTAAGPHRFHYCAAHGCAGRGPSARCGATDHAARRDHR